MSSAREVHNLHATRLDATDASDRQGFRGGPVRRRRNWTKEAKGHVVASMLAPGANVSEIARQHEVPRQHLYLWRRAALAGELPLPARLHNVVQTPIDVKRSPRSHSRPAASTYAVEIEVSGFLVRVQPDVDVGLLADIVKVLKTSA
jgi:transposase